MYSALSVGRRSLTITICQYAITIVLLLNFVARLVVGGKTK